MILPLSRCHNSAQFLLPHLAFALLTQSRAFTRRVRCGMKWCIVEIRDFIADSPSVPSAPRRSIVARDALRLRMPDFRKAHAEPWSTREMPAGHDSGGSCMGRRLYRRMHTKENGRTSPSINDHVTGWVHRGRTWPVRLGRHEDEDVLSYINAVASSLGTYLYGRRFNQMMVYWETAHTIPDLSQVELTGHGCGRRPKRSFTRGPWPSRAAHEHALSGSLIPRRSGGSSRRRPRHLDRRPRTRRGSDQAGLGRRVPPNHQPGDCRGRKALLSYGVCGNLQLLDERRFGSGVLTCGTASVACEVQASAGHSMSVQSRPTIH